MQTHEVHRVRAADRRGSSLPVLVDSAGGPLLLKLRGAGQGTGALVAEIIVAEIAEALGLRVPARCLADLATGTPTDDRHEEVLDLLAASVGLNLGFEVLSGAREPAGAEIESIAGSTEAAVILWLDRFVLNPDRTRRSPNVLLSGPRMWLIDHGAALRFQYDWPAVTEAAPRAAVAMREPHLFEEASARRDWLELDASCAEKLSRTTIESAVASVPDDFLVPLLGPLGSGSGSDRRDPETLLRRRRAAYAAFLWKRLQSPRAFATRSAALPAASLVS